MGRILLMLTVLLLTGFLQSYGQVLTVISLNDRKPIALVNVFNRSKEFSAVTDSLGRVQLTGFSGADVVNFQHTAYLKMSVPFDKIVRANNIVYLIERVNQLDEVVLSVDKTPETARTVGNRVQVIGAEDIAFRSPQTTADLLASEGQVFLQKSQMGGGSPVIRGFEANKVLIVIDGVRMNNAIYRGGHLQNAITLDADILERAEIVFGPGSLIFGSDALGGVMNFYTRDPKLSDTDKWKIRGTSSVRYASANREKRAHLDLGVSGKKLAFLSSITAVDYDDQRTGEKADEEYSGWGSTPYYVGTVGGVDQVLENPSPEVQLRTAYGQVDLLQKVLWQPVHHLKALLNIQYSTSTDVPRYDKLQEGLTFNSGSASWYEPGYARWDYGPQKRLLASLSLQAERSSKLFDKATALVAYQRIQEQRISRRFQQPTETHRMEDVDVLSANVDLVKDFKTENRLFYGTEVRYNKVESTAWKEDILLGTISDASTRYPDDGSHVVSAAVYVKHKWKLGQFSFAEGIRFNLEYLRSEFTQQGALGLDIERIRISNLAPSGAVEAVYQPGRRWIVKALLSSGFRSPNVDDVGKIFDPSPGILVIPNPDLKPEYVFNVESGVSKQFGRHLTIGASGFLMFVRNLIERKPGTFIGSDSIAYEGLHHAVFQNQNSEQALIAGVHVNVRAELVRGLLLEADVNYTHGRNRSDDVPLGHISPVYGQARLQYEFAILRTEFGVRYNGWKHLDNYSPNPQDNLEEATPDGTPGWYTLNFALAVDLLEQLTVQFGIDNIMDRHYRPFASGISAPGRNFMISLRSEF